jgi:outer membrane protein TolC
MKAILFSEYKLIESISKGNEKDNVIYMIVVMMMLSIVANAQNTITLSQAINNGLTNKKNISANKLDVTISNLQTQALYRKYWPQVSAEYTYLYNPILQTSILPIGVFNPIYPIDATKSVQFGTKWSQSAGLTAIQPLIDISIQRHIKEAKLQERIATLSQEQSEYELAYTIAQTYINIYLEESKIKALIADTNRTFISYILFKNKFDEKRLMKPDLNKSKINHNNAIQLLYDGIALLIEDKVYLLFLMGVNDIEKWDFAVDSNFSVKYPIVITLNPSHLDQLPDLQILTLQAQLTNLQVSTERTKHIPNINFKGYLGANQFANSFSPTAANSWFGLSYLGLDIKVPLLFGENLHNKTQQLTLQSNQYNLQKEDKTLQYTKDAMKAKLKIDNITTQLVTQVENIALSSESIDIFQARVNEGQESAANLNLEEVNLQLLEADYEANKRQLWFYWLNYLKATGQLSMLWK